MSSTTLSNAPIQFTLDRPNNILVRLYSTLLESFPPFAEIKENSINDNVNKIISLMTQYVDLDRLYGYLDQYEDQDQSEIKRKLINKVKCYRSLIVYQFADKYGIYKDPVMSVDLESSFYSDIVCLDELEDKYKHLHRNYVSDYHPLCACFSKLNFYERIVKRKEIEVHYIKPSSDDIPTKKYPFMRIICMIQQMNDVCFWSKLDNLSLYFINRQDLIEKYNQVNDFLTNRPKYKLEHNNEEEYEPAVKANIFSTFGEQASIIFDDYLSKPYPSIQISRLKDFQKKYEKHVLFTKEYLLSDPIDNPEITQTGCFLGDEIQYTCLHLPNLIRSEIKKELVDEMIMDICQYISRNYFYDQTDKLKGYKMIDGQRIEFIMYPANNDTYSHIKELLYNYLN